MTAFTNDKLIIEVFNLNVNVSFRPQIKECYALKCPFYSCLLIGYNIHSRVQHHNPPVRPGRAVGWLGRAPRVARPSVGQAKPKIEKKKFEKKKKNFFFNFHLFLYLS